MATDKIEKLIDDGIVDELVQRVKTGKEAEVYVVRKGTEYLAAKVYKERTERTFKNNAGYREGRVVRNTRDMRAIAKGTKYGVNRAEDEWMHTEHDACIALAEVGVRVPKSELFYEGVFLMELVLDAHGNPAPRLIEIAFTEEEAIALHAELTDMIIRMMLTDRIHGDLSAYNILMAWNGATIIDFPQVVSAATNSQAQQFLERDVRNVTEFLARYAPSLKARSRDGLRIWRAFERGELEVGFIPADHPELDIAPKNHSPQDSTFVLGTGRREVEFESVRPARPAADRPPRMDRPDRPPRPSSDRPDRPPRPSSDRPDHRPPRPSSDRTDHRPPRPSSDRPDHRPPRMDRPDRPPRPSGDRPQRSSHDAQPRPPRPPRSDRPAQAPGGHTSGRHTTRANTAPMQTKPVQQTNVARVPSPESNTAPRPSRHQNRRRGKSGAPQDPSTK